MVYAKRYTATLTLAFTLVGLGLCQTSAVAQENTTDPHRIQIALHDECIADLVFSGAATTADFVAVAKPIFRIDRVVISARLLIAELGLNRDELTLPQKLELLDTKLRLIRRVADNQGVRIIALDIGQVRMDDGQVRADDAEGRTYMKYCIPLRVWLKAANDLGCDRALVSLYSTKADATGVKLVVDELRRVCESVSDLEVAFMNSQGASADARWIGDVVRGVRANGVTNISAAVNVGTLKYDPAKAFKQLSDLAAAEQGPKQQPIVSTIVAETRKSVQAPEDNPASRDPFADYEKILTRENISTDVFNRGDLVMKFKGFKNVKVGIETSIRLAEKMRRTLESGSSP